MTKSIVEPFGRKKGAAQSYMYKYTQYYSLIIYYRSGRSISATEHSDRPCMAMFDWSERISVRFVWLDNSNVQPGPSLLSHNLLSLSLRELSAAAVHNDRFDGRNRRK